MIDTSSRFYPYARVHDSFYTLRGMTTFPKAVVNYLLDAPDEQYLPPDNNDYPRCRFWKYLYYDTPHPLSFPLPSMDEKMSVLFNPEKPTEAGKKGYRLFPQVYVDQSQETAQTRVMCYMGRSVPGRSEHSISFSVVFDIYTHYAYESNTKTDEYSRAFDIEQSLIEAFHGVYFNLDGLCGTFQFSRAVHPDCGSRVVFDGDTNVGRVLTMGFEVATEAVGAMQNTNETYVSGGHLHFW